MVTGGRKTQLRVAGAQMPVTRDVAANVAAIRRGIDFAAADNSDPADLPYSCPGGVVRPDGRWAAKAPTRGEQFFAYTIEPGIAR